MKTLRRAVIVSVLSVGASTLPSAFRQPAASLPAIDVTLLTDLGFTAHELRELDQHAIVARSTTADASAVALVVAGSVSAPAAFYLKQLRAIESFKKSPEILQIGQLSRSPTASEFAALTLDPSDVDDLKDCRIGDCGVKLDGDGISKIARRDIDLAAGSAAMRTYLADYARRYLAGGNGSLVEYRSESKPKRLEDQLKQILQRSPYLQRGWPSLYGAVAGYSGGATGDGLDDFLYWSKEKVGPRAVISLTHVIISPPRNGAAAVATKQLFASHYSEGSLGLTMLFDKSEPGHPCTRVIYVNRSNLDIFGGILGGIKRPLVRSRARDGAERTLRRLLERIEREYKESVDAQSF